MISIAKMKRPEGFLKTHQSRKEETHLSLLLIGIENSFPLMPNNLIIILMKSSEFIY